MTNLRLVSFSGLALGAGIVVGFLVGTNRAWDQAGSNLMFAETVTAAQTKMEVHYALESLRLNKPREASSALHRVLAAADKRLQQYRSAMTERELYYYNRAMAGSSPAPASEKEPEPAPQP